MYECVVNIINVSVIDFAPSVSACYCLSFIFMPTIICSLTLCPFVSFPSPPPPPAPEGHRGLHALRRPAPSSARQLSRHQQPQLCPATPTAISLCAFLPSDLPLLSLGSDCPPAPFPLSPPPSPSSPLPRE